MTDTPTQVPTSYRLIGPSDSGEVSDLLADRGAKDAKHRLQALIAEWLRMENLVVLSGAGTSVTSGGKIMTNLEAAVLETVMATNDFPAGAAAVIKARQEVDEKTRAGFEDWLSFLVNASYLGTAPGSPFNGVKWKGAADPSQADLSVLTERIGKAIFAECA